MNELMKIYQMLSKKGMINMSPEEFSQLPEKELMKYASLLEQPAQPMQTQQPMMRMGGRVKYQYSGYTDPYQVTVPNAQYSDVGTVSTSGLPSFDNTPKTQWLTDYANNSSSTIDLTTMAENAGDSGKGWDWSSKGGKAGAAATQVGGFLGTMGGNLLKDPEHPTSAKNVAGNILSSTAQGATLGSAFGPWGTLIGAVAGTIGGSIQSAQQKKAKEKELNMRSQGRYMNDLQTSYNPELAYGGALKPKISHGEAGDVVSYNAYPDPQAGDSIELARARSLGKSDTQFGKFANGASGKLSSTSRVRRAGYAQGGTTNTNYGSYMPNRYMQDGGELADAEIENNEAVIGNPNSVNLFGGADAEHASPLGFVAKGAQHGEKNSAGTSGIPMGSSEEMYVGSDKLTLNGWDARGGKKSVADEMKPYLKYAEKAVTSKDPYTNNPQAIKQTGMELARLQTEAEEGKFMRGLYDLVKRKDRDFDEVMGYLQQELPNEFGPNAQSQEEQLTQIENNPKIGQLPSTQEPDYAQMAGNAAVDINSLDAAMGQAPQGMTAQEQELMQAPAEQEQMMRNGGRLNMKTKNSNSKQIARAMCNTGCYTKPGRGMYQFGGNTLGIQGTEKYSTPDDQIIFENMSPEDQEQFANLDPQLAQNYLNQQRSFYGVPNTQAYQEPEMLPMAEITASNPLFDESSDLTDDEVKALMQEYAQTQGVPSNLVSDAMGNYFTPATDNMLANTKPYGQGQVALDYQDFTFEPGQGPTVTMPTLNYIDSKNITNRIPSIKDVGSQKNLWQNMMNRHASSRLGFVPFDENTLTATPELKQELLKQGFSQDDINTVNTPGGWGDASNPIVRWVNNMAGGSTLDVDIDDTGSRRMGSFGATQSSGVGSGTMEQTMTTLSNSLADDRKRRQLGLSKDVLNALDNLSTNGNLTADNIRRSLGQGVLDKVLTTIGSNRGTTISSNPAERLVTETHKQQGEKDLTTYKNAQGRTVTLDEAAKLARDYGWETFEYDGYEYPVPKSIPSRNSSYTSRPSTSTTKTTPTSGTITKSRSGQASTSETIPATIQPIRRAIDRNSEYQTITTQPIQKAMGGMTTPKVGQRITFEHGGRIHSGIVKYSNPYTGDFDIV